MLIEVYLLLFIFAIFVFFKPGVRALWALGDASIGADGFSIVSELYITHSSSSFCKISELVPNQFLRISKEVSLFVSKELYLITYKRIQHSPFWPHFIFFNGYEARFSENQMPIQNQGWYGLD